jgi:hypothetical protein
MPSRALTLFAVSIVLAASAAACGQAADTATSGATPRRPLTKREFIVRADAVCLRMVRSVEQQPEVVKRSPEKGLPKMVELLGRMTRELRVLRPPPGDEDEVQAVLLHLDRLRTSLRASESADGEQILAAVAAFGVESDAVARAAHGYGLFRSCSAFREIPEIRKIARRQSLTAAVLRRQAAKPIRTGPSGRSRALAIRATAFALIPRDRSMLRHQDCAGSTAGAPSCVTIELAPSGNSLAERRAAIAVLAARQGWRELAPTSGRRREGLLVLHRDRDDATVWLAPPGCKPGSQVTDGPSASVRRTSCADTIMVINVR